MNIAKQKKNESEITKKSNVCVLPLGRLAGFGLAYLFSTVLFKLDFVTRMTELSVSHPFPFPPC